MGQPRSPASRTGLTQEEYNWRRIYAVSALYICIIVVANLRTAWVAHPENMLLQPFFPGSKAADMRPAIFHARPSAALSQAAARIVDPSLFEELGSQGLEFREDMKNPCWSDAGTLKCLPYFYLLGPFQAGVRDIQAKMQRHPQIVRTANPEPHFWSENRPTSQFLRGMAASVDALEKNPSRNVIGYARSICTGVNDVRKLMQAALMSAQEVPGPVRAL